MFCRIQDILFIEYVIDKEKPTVRLWRVGYFVGYFIVFLLYFIIFLLYKGYYSKPLILKGILDPLVKVFYNPLFYGVCVGTLVFLHKAIKAKNTTSL